jgi:hypothetical protein
MPQIYFWSKNIGELKDYFLILKKSTKKIHYVVWVQYESSQFFFNHEWLVIAIRNVVSNEFLLIFFH